MPAEVSTQLKDRMVRLRAADYTKTEIADELGVNRNTVRRHLRRFREQFDRGNADVVVSRGER